MRIEEVDKNFAVTSSLSRSDVAIYDALSEPFKIFGLFLPKYDGDVFRRMPENVAKNVSEGVYYLHSNTAGGRIKFKTDANYIAIKAEMPAEKIGKMCHFPITGSAGFDLYTKYDGKDRYIKTFAPSFTIQDGFTSEIIIPKPQMREYTIHFPLYSDVTKVYIILPEGAKLESPDEYKIQKPVVYYGSSITQGGCASRPGNAYQNIISRELNCDHINLGFSGNAKGETQIADYIASLDMSAFVYDYDYNAPSGEHLQNTHKPMFDIIRKANPNLPIILVTRIVATELDNSIADERRAIILDTYEKAKDSGDENVYFIDGADFAKLAFIYDSITVDACHPNDMGFSCMAKLIGDKLCEIFS